MSDYFEEGGNTLYEIEGFMYFFLLNQYNSLSIHSVIPFARPAVIDLANKIKWMSYIYGSINIYRLCKTVINCLQTHRKFSIEWIDKTASCEVQNDWLEQSTSDELNVHDLINQLKKTPLGLKNASQGSAKLSCMCNAWL